MYKKMIQLVNDFGIPRIIIISFLIVLLIMAFILKIPIAELLSASLVRLGMHGILVLAMVPAINSGIGLNFGLPLGIICGLIGVLISIEFNLRGFTALFTAILCAIPIAAIIGYGYGVLLNKVKGSEMTVGTYVGFSAVSIGCIGWLILPFRSPEAVWPIGGGLRVTISLVNRLDKVLNNFMAIRVGNLNIPTGTLVFLSLLAIIIWLFSRSKTGIAMRTVGDNPRFAVASGLNVNAYRVIGTILSTVLGAIGIIVYAQSFGFLQLYTAPMFMGFTSVAAILIGGATVKKASIIHVFIGTFLFQSILVVALPVANKIMVTGDLAEISRITISNGIILYALTQIKERA
jgi:simple sugar transport system permease protein